MRGRRVGPSWRPGEWRRQASCSCQLLNNLDGQRAVHGHYGRPARAEIGGQKLVDVSVRRQTSETYEAALRLQGLRRAQEAGPCRKGQCTADADAPDAECRDGADTKSDVADDEEVERLGLDRGHERLDLVCLLWPRCEEHVGARLCVRLETANGFAEGVRMADVVALSSRGQQHAAARSID